MNQTKIREQAMFCVYQSLLLNQDINTTIDNQVSDELLEDGDNVRSLKNNHFFQTITVNVFNNMDVLIEALSENLIDWKFDRLGYIEQAILLVGATEIFTAETDKKVVINEAVNLAKKYGDDDTYKLINGVLDKL